MWSTSALSLVDLTCSRLTTLLPILLDEHNIRAYTSWLPSVDDLCYRYVRQAFRQLDEWRCESLQSGRTLPKYDRLLRRLMEIRDEGTIAPITTSPACADVHGPGSPAHSPTPTSLALPEPAWRSELELVNRCGAALAHVITGRIAPLGLFFPNGSIALLQTYYSATPFSAVLNALIAEAVAQAEQCTSRGLRIIELGAGTGATTRVILNTIQRAPAEYAFTDVSQSFLSAAAQEFGRYEYARFRRLDLDREPGNQGFAARSYDIVIAANVLHATQSIRQSLRHVRTLLAPGGLFVFREATEPNRRADITFGQLDGWWRFTDVDLRPTHPLISVTMWLRLLTETGFSSPGVIPSSDAMISGLGRQAVLIADAL